MKLVVCACSPLLWAVGGCQQRGPSWDLTPVEGTVAKAGVPMAGIEVTFRPDPDADTKAPRSRGYTDETGRFHLRTDMGEWGAVPGRYRVCVVDGAAKPETPEEKRRVQDDYGRFDKTSLRADVGKEPLVFDIPIP